MKKELTYTATSYNDEDVFEYIVCWRKKNWDWEWNRKYFAQKKNAKQFAKEKRKEDNTKPYPYIIQHITTRDTFRYDVECESAENVCKTIVEKVDYRKYIKY